MGNWQPVDQIPRFHLKLNNLKFEIKNDLIQYL